MRHGIGIGDRERVRKVNTGMEKAGRRAPAAGATAARQPGEVSLAGKKRKKKKREENSKNGGSGSRGSGAKESLKSLGLATPGKKFNGIGSSTLTTVKSKPAPSSSLTGHAPSSLCGSGPAVVRSVEEGCSSTSSLETTRPMKKLGRFDCSSSDAMSLSQTSSSTMEASSTNHSHTVSPSQSKRHFPVPIREDVSTQPRQANFGLHVTGMKMTDQPPHSSTLQPGMRTVTSNSHVPHHIQSSKDNLSPRLHASPSSKFRERISPREDALSGKVPRREDEDVAVESLRWELECSDQDEERQRIETYKANRRRRYEKALEERRKQLTGRTAVASDGMGIIARQSSESVS